MVCGLWMGAGMSEAQAALEERTEDGDRMMGWVRMAKKK
jgi:hypothetical protein